MVRHVTPAEIIGAANAAPAAPVSTLMVPIPKSNNDIHVCVDMRCANIAIQGERFPLPISMKHSSK